MRRRTVTVFLIWLVLAPTLAVAGRAKHQPHPALQPIADRLLVLNKLDDNLMVFEAPNRQPITILTVGNEPHEIAVTPDGRKAYVSNVGDRSRPCDGCLSGHRRGRPTRTCLRGSCPRAATAG